LFSGNLSHRTCLGAQSEKWRGGGKIKDRMERKEEPKRLEEGYIIFDIRKERHRKIGRKGRKGREGGEEKPLGGC